MTAAELNALAERVDGLRGKPDNSIDVLCEVALFSPGSTYTAIRANDRGTKVIYTDKAGNDVTCWAMEWTARDRQALTAAALRALATKGE